MVLRGNYIKMRQDHAPVILSGSAPDFTWVSEDGKTHYLNELAGHAVVLHFWAAWCEPCRLEFPELVRNAGTLGKDVTVLAISNDLEPATTQKFIQRVEKVTHTKTPDNLIYIFDGDRKITADLFQTMAFPETIFIDKSLHMRSKIAGKADWGSVEMRNYLAQLKQ